MKCKICLQISNCAGLNFCIDFFFLQFAEGMLEGEHFPFSETEDSIRQIRKEIAVKLLQESGNCKIVTCCKF